MEIFTQIVLANSAKSGFSSALSTAGQMIFLLFVFGVVLFLAYIATKFIAGNRQIGTGGNLEIIESLPIGNQSAIQLVRAGATFVLVGVTKEKITFLTEIDASHVDLSLDRQSEGPVFVEEYIKKFTKKGKDSDGGDDSEE